MPSRQILKRTVAAGTIAGCSAVGLGALSAVAAPAANACFLGCHSTQNTTSNTSKGSGLNISFSQNNGTTTQSTGALSGNQLSVPVGLGLAPVNTSANTSISNVAIANGTLNPVTIVAAQTTTNITTTTTTTTTVNTGVTPVVP